ncbi:hypothetical protein YC2023_118208 [Brassica napus]
MNCRISSSSLSVRTRIPKESGEAIIAPEPGDSRRFLYNTAMIWPKIMQMPIGRLIEKLREMDGIKDRIRLGGLARRQR